MSALKISNFVLIAGNGKRTVEKKWKDVPFAVDPLAHDELVYLKENHL